VTAAHQATARNLRLARGDMQRASKRFTAMDGLRKTVRLSEADKKNHAAAERALEAAARAFVRAEQEHAAAITGGPTT
jgi:hypothetical protein